MRVLVCGGREFHHWAPVVFAMKEFVGNFRGPNPGVTIIQGGAKGADFLGKVYADYVGWKCEEYPADWKTYGKRAGHIRNQQMIDEGKPDLVIAFAGGTGTADMVRRAKKHNIKVIEVK